MDGDFLIRLTGADINMPSACVLTVGKFESIHTGHRKLIAEVAAYSKGLGIPSAVVTFNPHPNVLFGEPEYKSLFTPDEREYILSGLGIDCLLEYPFDRAFASQTPEAFAALLFDRLRARVLVVGDGFRFGKGQAGTVGMLRAIGRGCGANVVTVPALTEDGGGKISTSGIRKLVTAGKLEPAARAMGFNYFIVGTVVHGRHIGTGLGFPTANIIPPAGKLLPTDGVYATNTCAGGKEYPGVTNVGVKPTVSDGPGERTVETFLIGCEGDLYGVKLRTEFRRFIRPEQKFESIGALRERIAEDVESARRLFD